MSSGDFDSKQEAHQGHDGHVEVNDLKEKNIRGSEVLVDSNLMNDAFQGENREHEMGMWEAVKLYPMACTWAFIFCFTIVSDLPVRCGQGSS